MEERHKCPVCGLYEFEYSMDICEHCGWQDDPIQEKDPDYKPGANRLSLNEAKKNYVEIGRADPLFIWSDDEE